jgi:hypothetical protein
LSSVTVPPEAWLLSGYESFAAMGADQQNVEQTPALLRELDQLAAQDGELLTGTRSITAVYREDMSYRPNVNIGEMRYFTITMFTLRPGYTAPSPSRGSWSMQGTRRRAWTSTGQCFR